ncbi:unnamed protein product [Auanema sp. JU1783]|nr:unnamed protein product [Auanema sp. JU1783]
MLKSLATILALIALSPFSHAYVERECPCSKDDGNGLWLDISIAIDVSAGMGSESLIMTVGDIASLFPTTAIGNDTGPSPGQTSRIAITTFDTRANTVFGLNDLTSNNDFNNQIWNIININTTNPTSSLKVGLSGALSALTKGRADGKRSNFRQVIIVYTATCDSTPGDDDPSNIASDIKGDNIDIIMVGYDKIGNGNLKTCVKNLASPNSAFANTDSNLVGEIQQALCQVNCFCAPLWSNFHSGMKKFGTCIRLGNSPALYQAAKHSCNALAPDSYLVNEFSAQKHNFVVGSAKGDPTFKVPHLFYIGLTYVNGQWLWEQQAGSSQIPYVQSNDTSFGWCPGFPDGKETAGNSCVLETPLSSSETQVCWQNVPCIPAKYYYCQRNTCDVNNFCP